MSDFDFTSVSPVPDLPKVPQETAHEFCISRAEYFGNKGRTSFLIDGLSGNGASFKDVDNKSRSIASYFFKKGFRKGDIVIYMTSHQIHTIPLMIGVWRANGIVRSLYVDEAEETILQKLQESSCKFMFCDEENAETCRKIGEKCAWPVEIVICGGKLNGFGNMEDLYSNDGEQCPETEVTNDDLALIVPTSGTTGPSKGAAHSHKSVIYHIRVMAMIPFFLDKPNVIASKSTHISGIMAPFAMLAKGTLGIVLPRVNKEIMIQTVDKYKPGLAFAFPSFLLAMGSAEAEGYDMSSVERIFTGGMPVTPELHKAYLSIGSVKNVLIGYGLTELACMCTNVDFDNNDNDIQTYTDCACVSVGKPFPGVEVQIRDLDTLEPVGPNVRGEVCGKGPSLFKEYFKNPKATADTFVDGWLRTGDVGYLDEKGYLHIVDRAKDIFKYFHNHISPTEIEALVSEHPGVKEVCVVPVPDEGGEVPRAFVVLKNSPHVGKKSVADEIKQFANGKLVSYKHLRGGVFIVDDLPKGKTGKVTRNLVADMALPNY